MDPLTSLSQSDRNTKAQSLVKDKGKHTLIDKVQVRYISDDDKHWAELKNFGHKYVHVPEHYLRDYDRLLMGGIWAQIEIRHQYDEEAKGKRSPFWINKRNFLEVSGDIVERVDPIFFSDPTTAAMKALGVM